MGLGLKLLESAGIENNIINVNPTITFFKKVYKFHSNISNEILPQYFKSSPNFGKRLTINIGTNADIMGNMTLYFELPEIPASNHSTLPSGIKKFAWAKNINLALINYIDLEIGGILISRVYNDWLYIDNLITTATTQIINNLDHLSDYTDGKNSHNVYIPLNFFFNNYTDLSLPLIALSKQDIKINIELNNLSMCYNESPNYYFEIDTYICLFQENEIIRKNVNNNKSGGVFVYFDINTKRVSYDLLYNEFMIPTTSNNIL